MSRSVYKRVFACLLAALVAVCALPVSAQPKSQDDIARRLAELERLRQELDAKEGDLRGDIAVAAERREHLTEELSELQAIVNEVQARVDVASSHLAGIQAQVDRKDAAIRKAQKLLEHYLDDLGRRAIHIYKRGPASVFDFLTKIRSITDFFRNFGYMAHIIREDNERVAEIAELKSKIKADRDKVVALRDRAAAQVAVVASERDRAATIRNTAAARRDAVAGELAASYEALGDIEAQRAQYDRETSQLQAESAAIAAFLRGRGDTPAQVSPKGMTWPASGPLTSGFGWRTHPIFGTKRFHAGVDIGAGMGAPIVAAGSGTVIFVGMKGGYGNTTIIDHGGGIATLYAHQSSIGVSNGARVAIGQRIGSVGSTGYSTGPHLHFEVRVNGDPVDPMGWLP